MTRHGYGRVSTNDQHPEYQRDRLLDAGCAEPLFIDRGYSGSQASRPRWDKLLAILEPGDELAITKLDRMARSVANLFDIMATLEARGVGLVVLDRPDGDGLAAWFEQLVARPQVGGTGVEATKLMPPRRSAPSGLCFVTVSNCGDV